MSVEIDSQKAQPFWFGSFTSLGGTSVKIRKARTMRPKRRAGTRAAGDGEWRMFRKPKAPPPPPKKPKKERR